MAIKVKEINDDAVLSIKVNKSYYLMVKGLSYYLYTQIKQENKEEYLKEIMEGKYENMDKIFNLNRDNPVKKYLIFTEYESALNSKITSILDKYGLTYARIRGSSVSISSMVETYRQADDKINVLLINSKYFGSGLNLENTSDIIILHKMQADIEMQVIGRAQRYGRKTNLNVWKLYYQNEENY